MISIIIKGKPHEVKTWTEAWEKIRNNRRGCK